MVLAGLGGLKDDAENLESEVRLLYVGMTRARQQLLLTGSGGNWFVGRFGGRNYEWDIGLEGFCGNERAAFNLTSKGSHR